MGVFCNHFVVRMDARVRSRDKSPSRHADLNFSDS